MSRSGRLGDDRPYPGRAAPLPRHLDDVTDDWFARELALRYPGIALRSWEVVEVRNTHTTKVRVRVEWNEVGVEAGIPERLCLKANWSGMHTGEITAREARF